MKEQKKNVFLWILGVLTIILVVVTIVLTISIVKKNENEKELMYNEKELIQLLSKQKAELETKLGRVKENNNTLQEQLDEINNQKNDEKVKENTQEDNGVLQSFSGINTDIKAIKSGVDDNGETIIKYEVKIEGNTVVGIEDEHSKLVDGWPRPYFETEVIGDKNNKDRYVVLITCQYRGNYVSLENLNAYIIDTKGNIINDKVKISKGLNVYGVYNRDEVDTELDSHSFSQVYTPKLIINVKDYYYLYDTYENSDKELEVHKYSVENGKFIDKLLKKYKQDEWYPR